MPAARDDFRSTVRLRDEHSRRSKPDKSDPWFPHLKSPAHRRQQLAASRAQLDHAARQRNPLDGALDVSDCSRGRHAAAADDMNLVGIETHVGALSQLDFDSIAGPKVGGSIVSPLGGHARAAEIAHHIILYWLPSARR